ncbi:MAG: hypothetical protein ABSH47_16950 [Bryobacteraceae bacterium]|jgi:uncharacterized protein (TIGR03437 family)
MKIMSGKTLLCLALLSATGVIAASSGFLLGVDYSEWTATNATQIATDSSGALYILSSFPSPGVLPPANPTPSWVTKLSADGKTMLWQNQLGFAANTMAVDPNGGVYVMPVSLPGDTSIYVAKLGTDGTGIAWKTPVGFILPDGWQPMLAVDSSGRAYVAGENDVANSEADVVRLNAAGTAVDYTAHVAGQPNSIAVDGSGAAFITGYGNGGSFLARLAPDGSAGFYSPIMQSSGPPPVVAVDANGDPVVYFSVSGADRHGVLQHFDSTGEVTSSKTIAAGEVIDSELALDAAGNAYIMGSAVDLYPVRNSLATCGWDLLSVFAPDGSLLQSTYIPGGEAEGAVPPLVATGPNSTVFVVDAADATFAPTQTGPFPSSGAFSPDFVVRLSPNPNAQTFPLACMGNAATYSARAPLAPGEIVTLFGNGLGPQQGIQTQATLQSNFPKQEASVVVTFDGKPAPLLWVQDAQINAVVPWSLTPGQNTRVCVSYNSVQTNCLTRPVEQVTWAGVFTVDGTYAAALNQDGTINTANNPAAPGSIVSIFATGLGPITPPQADGSLVGLPLPSNVLLPVEVQAISYPRFNPYPPVITKLNVTYAGPAPYLVAGVTQINFQVVNAAEGGISVTAPSQSQGFQVYIAGQ